MRTKFVQLFSGETVQTVFKLAYLWLVLLSFNSFFAETVLLSYCSYALALFGAPIVLARVVDFKAYRRMPLIGLMCLFLISFLISAISAAKYGITSNVQGFAWMTFEFFILFAHSSREEVNRVFVELDLIAKCVCWYAIVCSCLGLIMAVVGYSDAIVVREGVINYFGIREGRLWGVYSDPNIGAVVCVIAVLFGCWLYARKEICAATFVINTFVQLGYVALSGSRGSLLCAIAATFVVVSLFAWGRFPFSSVLKRVVRATSYALAGCIIVSLCTFIVGDALQKCSLAFQARDGYTQPFAIISDMHPKHEVAYALEAEEIPAESISGSAESTRGEGFSEREGYVGVDDRFVIQGTLAEFSAGRLSIWESALDLFKSSPLVGVSHRNILVYAQDVLPDTFIARSGYTTMHNIIIDVLVSQGIIGLIVFVFIIVRGLRWVAAASRNTQGAGVQGSLLAGVLAAVCVAAMFYTEILYINSPSSVVFWITLGALCQMGRTDLAIRTQDDQPEEEEARP